jgi:hypothetical protein
MKAWHFVSDTFRNGYSIPADGEKLIHKGNLIMCKSGLHASKRIIDALSYAPGYTICRVEVGGKIIEDDDKLVSSERTILWRLDAEEILRKFARMCALDVIHLWDVPQIVKDYLKTGDESIRLAAWAAARDAARDAAGDAARDAAGAAAGAAAGDAAWAAAGAAAGDAAWAAAWAAARAAAEDAAWEKQNRRLTRMVIYEKQRKPSK